MGKSPAFLLVRLLALVLALGLGGGYVWMRQRQAAPPQPEEILFDASDTAGGEEGRKDRVLLPGSERGVLPPPPEEKQRRLLPGSKSIDSVLEGGDFIRREDFKQLPEQREETEEP